MPLIPNNLYKAFEAEGRITLPKGGTGIRVQGDTGVMSQTAISSINQGAAAGDKITGATLQWFKDVEDARVVSEVHAGAAKAMRSLTDYSVELDKDPDHNSTPDKLRTRGSQLKAEALRTMTPKVGQAFAQKFDISAAPVYTKMQISASNREIVAQKGRVIDLFNDKLDAALSVGSSLGAWAEVEDYAATLRTMVRKGSLNPFWAETMIKKFEEAVGNGLAARDVNINPENAKKNLKDPKWKFNYPGLTEVMRAKYIEAASDEIERIENRRVINETRENNRKAKELTTLQKNHATDAWVSFNQIKRGDPDQEMTMDDLTKKVEDLMTRRQISETAGPTILAAIRKDASGEAEPEDDAETVGEIAKLVVRGDPEAEKMMLKALDAKKIKTDTYVGFIKTLHNNARSNGLKYLINALEPLPGQKFSVQDSRRYAEAVKLFDIRMREQRKEDPFDIANEIVQRAVGEDFTQLGTFIMPKFSTSKTDRKKLEKGQKELEKAFAAGSIGVREFNVEAARYQKILDALDAYEIKKRKAAIAREAGGRN